LPERGPIPQVFRILVQSALATAQNATCYSDINGQVIAEADAYEQVEGNVYFPPDSVKAKHALSDAELTTFCPWKGTASYYNIAVDGKPGLDFP